MFLFSGIFYKTVWQSLKDNVTPGQTISYGELSEMITGSKKSSRAVGTAMKKNPFTLIVPCHRVVKSDGGIGNYSGGKNNHVKEWLLRYEKGQNSCCNI